MRVPPPLHLWLGFACAFLSAVHGAEKQYPIVPPADNGGRDPEFAPNWAAHPLRSNVAAADVIAIGKIVEFLPSRPFRASKGGAVELYGRARSAVSSYLMDWEWADAVAAAQARPGTPAPKSPPNVIEILLSPQAKVNPNPAAAPLKADEQHAPAEYNRATPYIFFLNRITDQPGLALMDSASAVVADEKTIAAVREAMKFGAWEWGKSVAGLRACLLPTNQPRVELEPGKGTGYSYMSGTVVIFNGSANTIEVEIGQPQHFGPPTDKDTVLEAIRVAGGDTVRSRAVSGVCLAIAPRHYAVIRPPKLTSNMSYMFGFKGIAPGETRFQFRIPIARINGKAPAAGQDVLETAPLTVEVTVQPTFRD